jgi:hypothetical protein
VWGERRDAVGRLVNPVVHEKTWHARLAKRTRKNGRACNLKDAGRSYWDVYGAQEDALKTGTFESGKTVVEIPSRRRVVEFWDEMLPEDENF